MINQEFNQTKKLESLMSRIFAIYREIEFELIHRERDEIRIERLISDLDIAFEKICEMDLFNQDTSWIQNTLNNAKKNRQMTEGSADAMNQLTDQLMNEMDDERLKNSYRCKEK